MSEHTVVAQCTEAAVSAGTVDATPVVVFVIIVVVYIGITAPSWFPLIATRTGRASVRRAREVDRRAALFVGLGFDIESARRCAEQELTKEARDVLALAAGGLS